MFDWGDGTMSEWLGPYPSGDDVEKSHIWTEFGDYEVKVIAKDTFNGKSEWSEPHLISIVPNSAPDNPTITGPSTGQTHKQLDFIVSSTDPEGHDVSYNIYWGDGDYTDYGDLCPSGEYVTFSHAYNTAGDFNIAVKARDQYGAKSGQTSFKVKILKNRAITNPILQRIVEQLIAQFPILSRLLTR